VALDLQDRHDEAQAAYQAALARRPGMTAAQVNLGLSLALTGATDRALAILRPLATDPAADGRVRQNLAVALALAGDAAGAGKVLAAELPPEKIETALAGYAALKVSVK
jgi:Flp pilus assembly protein TadD